MTRYIDADALKEQMFNYYDCVNEGTFKGGYSGQTLMDYEVADLIRDCIDDAPTADVAPVRHGKWTTHRTEKHDGEWYCTECDYEPEVFTGSNFCSNCGAKMDLED